METILNQASWITGKISTPSGNLPVVSTKISIYDKAGSLLMRIGINRMNYTVQPGLYATGTPDMNSPVFISANRIMRKL